jgi:hypothetical protein
MDSSAQSYGVGSRIMPDWISEILRPLWDAIGTLLLAGGGGAFIALAVTRIFGERWLNHRFATKMAEFTHAQDRQIEQLKFRISALIDRRTKLHQREFEVLPAVWAKIVKAHQEAARVLSVFKSYLDISEMDDEDLRAHLTSMEFSDRQIIGVMSSKRRQDEYVGIIEHRRMVSANNLLYDSNELYLTSAIFMQENLSDKFKSLLDLIRRALQEHKYEVSERPLPRIRNAREEFEKRSEIMLDEIKNDIQSRLWSPDAMDGDD